MGVFLLNYFSLPFYGVFKNKRNALVLLSTQLILVLSLRGINVGADLAGYKAGFNYISSLNIVEMISTLRFFDKAVLPYPLSYESGYVVFNWIIGKTGLNFRWFLIICAIINISAVSHVIYKYSYIPWISYVVYIGMGIDLINYGILRQALAFSVFLLSIEDIEKNRFFRFFIKTLISFTLHRSFMVVIPLFFLAKASITRKKMVYCLACVIAMFGLSGFLYKKFFVGFLFRILNKTNMLSGGTSDFKMNNLLLLFILILILFAYIKNYTYKPYTIENISLWAFILGIFVEILGMNNELFARAVLTFEFFLAFIVPNVFLRDAFVGTRNREVTIKSRDSITFTYGRNYVIFVIYLLLFVYLVYILTRSQYVPYHLWIDDIV